MYKWTCTAQNHVVESSPVYCWPNNDRISNFILLKKFFYVYLFLRKKKRAQAGKGQRERKTQNLKQALSSELSAQSPTQGSNSWTVRS